ncbi:MAG: hypothetical protein PUC37_08755 [Spirochaetales bacterium]|nr:hypothetical protein [Spirochaetales bacterium]
MNRIIKNTFTASLLLICGFLFASCFDPIFFEIRNEIPPEEPTVSGVIQHMVRYTSGGNEYILCVADGGVRYKRADNESHGSWDSMGLPFSSLHYDFNSSSFKGEYPIALAADNNNIYLASIKIRPSVNGTNEVYEVTIRSTGTINGSWSEVWSKNRSDSSSIFTYNYYSDYVNLNFNMFCTNSPKNANRKAYFREGDSTLYELSGTSKTEITTNNVCLDSNSATKWNSAVSFGGETLFFHSGASETNETPTADATKVYYSDDNDLYYSSIAAPVKASGATAFARDDFGFSRSATTNYLIRSIAVCNDCILMAKGDLREGYGGISVVSLNAEGVPESDLTNSRTHVDRTISPNYLVPLVFNATPGNNETSSILYATTAIPASGNAINVSYKDIGLFAYFPTRGNWNRE